MTRLTNSRNSKAQCVAIVVLQAWFALAASAASFQLVSVTDSPAARSAGGGGDSYLPVISRDGRYVLFASIADNLAVVETNRSIPALFPAPINVFLRDRTKGSTVLVSVSLDGTGGGDSDSVPIGVSTNGRYALFESTASNLVPGDTNNAADVFVRDLVNGTTTLVSVSTNGGFANNASYSSAMTPDGRYVSFVSAADNVVPGDTNTIPDVFARDLVSKVTTLVSVGARPQPSSNPYSAVGSDAPVVTPDGRYVAFYSTATNLAPGGALAGVYLRDQELGTTTWVSQGALTALQSVAFAANSISFNQAVSADGRYVAFEAIAYPQLSPGVILRYDIQTGHTDLIETNAAVPSSGSYEGIQNLAMTPDGRFVAYVADAFDTSGATTEIRIWDAQSGTSTLVSGDTNNPTLAGSISDSPTITDNGRFVAFLSSATDLVTNGLDGDFHLFVRDLQLGTTTLVDADINGVGSAVDPNTTIAMSADGQLVAFDCQDSNLVPLDNNRSYDVFLRDLARPTAELISAHNPGLPSLTAFGASGISSYSVSADARFIAFWSDADDLVANDTNGLRDIVVRDLLGGTNVLVSVGTNGFAGDGESTDVAISSDGRYVAFTSLADDLVSGDTNQSQDVFVRDLQTGTTTLASVNATGSGPGNRDSFSPILSGGGRFVLFHSKAGNLSPGMPVGTENLFCRDLQSKTTYPLTTNGVTATSMTPDGRSVAFLTSSTKFVAGPDRLYLWDSQSASNVYSLNGGIFGTLALSADGQRIAYVTNASSTKQLLAVDRALNTNWVIASYRSSSSSPPRFSADSRFLVYVGSVGATTYTNEIYLYDFQTGSNVLISQSYDGSGPGNDSSDSVEISSDGRFISYRSAASNLVPGDTNGVPDIFLYDRLSSANTLITASRFGGASADNRSLTPVFSGNGQTLVFESWASDLIPDDFNANLDVFSLGLSGGTVGPQFQAMILPIANAASGYWLSWPAVTGKSYRVQFKNRLEDPVWQELAGQISVLGDRGYLQDLNPGTTQRYYRITAF